MTDQPSDDFQAKFKKALERKREQQSPKSNSRDKSNNPGKAQGSKASSQMFRRKSGSA
jgi:hypothetical protein